MGTRTSRTRQAFSSIHITRDGRVCPRELCDRDHLNFSFTLYPHHARREGLPQGALRPRALELREPGRALLMIKGNSETESPLIIKRARDGTRTRDPDLGKVVLHQLSHSRISQTIYFSVLFSSTKHIISYEPKNVNTFFTGFTLFSPVSTRSSPHRARSRRTREAL